ncbi:alpha/beta hydrolase fold domain-containing protein [Cryobacterium melibiosiphilum]|uniref:alpha/beta hydrolase fold domain-containing protein n=1 Tax=Cryobacterium melibiosiphilum TaxID=995039 RepID=UPI0011C23BCE
MVFGRSPAVHYPVPVDDVVAVVRAVQREAPNGVILGGASAGACLSAGAVLRMADQGRHLSQASSLPTECSTPPSRNERGLCAAVFVANDVLSTRRPFST